MVFERAVFKVNEPLLILEMLSGPRKMKHFEASYIFKTPTYWLASQRVVGFFNFVSLIVFNHL